jgi:hypothetical protein
MGPTSPATFIAKGTKPKDFGVVRLPLADESRVFAVVGGVVALPLVDGRVFLQLAAIQLYAYAGRLRQPEFALLEHGRVYNHVIA